MPQRIIINPNWVTGLTDGEGYFCAIKRLPYPAQAEYLWYLCDKLRKIRQYETPEIEMFVEIDNQLKLEI